MKTIQVLIVDDCAVTRKMVQNALCRAPITATLLKAGNGQQCGLIRIEVKAFAAASADEAIAITNGKHLDLIFSDISMPGMDGLEFLRRLRSTEETKEIPVVMITADGSTSAVTEALAQGADGYLKKPFSAQEVRDRMRGWLNLDTLFQGLPPEPTGSEADQTGTGSLESSGPGLPGEPPSRHS
jgi:two-component system, chemotaxis family, chemotaxis protein CheY